MSLTRSRNRKLEEKLTSLHRRLILPAIQQRIREDVLNTAELLEVRDELYPEFEDLEADESANEFKMRFDHNAEANLAFLMARRQVSQFELILDLALEVGLITEAEFGQYRRQVANDTVVRRTVPLQFIDGSLYRGGELVKRLQARTPPTRLQLVLQMFQDQDWPKSISAPADWSPENVKSVCGVLREHFKDEFYFSGISSGKIIEMTDLRVPSKVVPK